MTPPPDGPAGAPGGLTQADPRVLGQLLAAQNLLAVLPTARQVAEFYAHALASLPGVSACRVCLPGAVATEGTTLAEVCAGCELLTGADAGAAVTPEFQCRLAGEPDVRVVAFQNATARFGFFVLRVGDRAGFEPYRPFVENLGNFVALFLENRAQKARLEERTRQLEVANGELEAFAYSVSHDLRAPLRHVGGFLELLRKHAGGALDAQSEHYLGAISDAAGRMGTLIDDLLSFSRMGRFELSRSRVELRPLAEDVVREHAPDTRGRTVRWHVGDLPVVVADRAMLRVALVNLVSNALKFTRPRPVAEIEIGCRPGAGEQVLFVRDNGVGFDMTYAGKLFRVFERLHRAAEFEGTGIGLATVRRVALRHGGRTWAEGAPDRGATFYLSLPQPAEAAPGAVPAVPERGDGP